MYFGHRDPRTLPIDLAHTSWLLTAALAAASLAFPSHQAALLKLAVASMPLVMLAVVVASLRVRRRLSPQREDRGVRWYVNTQLVLGALLGLAFALLTVIYLAV